MSTPEESFDLWKILSESRRVIKSQSNHFQALVAIFLLPSSISISVYVILQTTIFKSQPSPLSIRILINLVYILFVNILAVFSVASISYSAFHAFYGTPVDLTTSIKSISHSFFRLFSTLIIQELYLALFSWPLVLLAVKIYGSESFYNSSASNLFFAILFLLMLMYVQAKLILVPVIVVVESKWSWVPMQRSDQLVKGKRGVAFSMVFLFSLLVVLYLWGIYPSSSGNWRFVLYTITASTSLALIFQFSLVANVVLYVYCMEMHGEVLPYSRTEEVPLLK